MEFAVVMLDHGRLGDASKLGKMPQYGVLHRTELGLYFTHLIAALTNCRIGILQAMTCQCAYNLTALRNLAALDIAQRARHRNRRGRFAENALALCQQLLGSQDFLVTELIEPAAGLLLSVDRLVPTLRIADANCHCHRFGILHRVPTATNPKTNLARCFHCERNFNTIDMVIVCKGLRFVEGVKYLKTILNNCG